jgi:hypothetical protein
VRADRSKLLPEFVAHQTQSEYGRATFLAWRTELRIWPASTRRSSRHSQC